MPDMNGIEVLKAIGEKESKICTVMVSADIQKTTGEKCERLGAVGFINKPVKGESRERLLEIMNSHLETDS